MYEVDATRYLYIVQGTSYMYIVQVRCTRSGYYVQNQGSPSANLYIHVPCTRYIIVRCRSIAPPLYLVLLVYCALCESALAPTRAHTHTCSKRMCAHTCTYSCVGCTMYPCTMYYVHRTCMYKGTSYIVLCTSYERLQVCTVFLYHVRCT